MAEFNYEELCRMQEIQVATPEGVIVPEYLADQILDLILRMCRVRNKIVKLKIDTLDELRFAKNNNNMVHGQSYTASVGELITTLFRDLSSASGIEPATRNLTTNDPLVMQVKVSLGTCLDVLINESRKIMVGTVNKRTAYEKYGSDAGYSPFLDVNDAIEIAKRTIYLENTAYDYMYVAGLVALGSFAEIYGDQAGEVVRQKLHQFELFEGEGESAFKSVMKSFNPASRFDTKELGLYKDVVFAD